MTDWKAGQQAAIDRRKIVTIDRVTPSGMAIVGSRTFNKDGRERGTHGRTPPYLEPLTEENTAAIVFQERGEAAGNKLHRQVKTIGVFLSHEFSVFRKHRTSDVNAIEKAERLSAAIARAMEDVP